MTLDSPLRASPADIMSAFSIADEPEATVLPMSRRVSRLIGRLDAFRTRLGAEPTRVVGRIKAAFRFDRIGGGENAALRVSQPTMWPAWAAAGRCETERSRPYRGQIRSHFDCSSRPGEKRIA